MGVRPFRASLPTTQGVAPAKDSILHGKDALKGRTPILRARPNTDRVSNQRCYSPLQAAVGHFLAAETGGKKVRCGGQVLAQPLELELSGPVLQDFPPGREELSQERAAPAGEELCGHFSSLYDSPQVGGPAPSSKLSFFE